MTERLYSKVSTALLLIACGVGFARAGDFSADAKGTTSANFLKLGVSARAAGMGEAQAAAVEGADALYWNPAGLSKIEDGALTLMHGQHIENTYFDYAALAHRVGESNVIAVGAQYFNAGKLKETDPTGLEVGNFTPSDLAVSLGWALKLGDWGIGVSGKYIQSKIMNTATGMAGDAGIVTPEFGEKFRLGASVSNLGGKIKYDQVEEELPVVARAGVSYKVTEGWLLAADAVAPKDNNTYGAVGLERKYGDVDKNTLSLRVGYNSRSGSDIKGISGVSGGVGVGFGKASLDYALVPFGDLGLSHRVSLSARF